MEHYVIDDREAASDFLEYVRSTPKIKPTITGNVVEFNGDQFEVEPKFSYVLRRLNNEPKSGREGNRETQRKDSLVEENRRDTSSDTISSSNGTGSNSNEDIESLVFGKDNTQFVIAAEIVDDHIHLFKNDGSVEVRPMEYWFLSSRRLGTGTETLEGDLFFKYMKRFECRDTFTEARSILFKKRTPLYTVYDPVEAYMVLNGLTFFKGLKVDQVSVLSFDIETTGVAHNDNSDVLLISNTFRNNEGKISRKLFALDDYNGETEVMIKEWCEWVVATDPSILIGHNIFTFDLPYLSFCYERETGEALQLGKNGKVIKYAKKPKKVRKDGSQSYDVYEAKIFGRQIIDTWILAIKYDFGRKYESYALKQIIKQEGLEKKDRTKWNFDEIMPHEIWSRFQDGDDEMWNDFKKYCIEDSDDSLKLYDLMIPSFFYYTQSLPMPFQTMNMTATGRQLNGFLCRSYLQQGHSLPEKSEKEAYEGAISFGNPGVYSHVYKVDVASLYPSIMITEEIYDKDKDPKAHFLQTVKYFTAERLENKRLGKETGDRYYKDMEQAQKIVINSAYGLLGASGLNFNSPSNADKVTATGREILQKGIEWVCGRNLIKVPVLDANGNPKTNKEGEVELEYTLSEKISEGNGFRLVNVDTDSFSYTANKKLVEITEKQAEKKGVEPRNEFQEHIDDINSLYKDGIRWEDDGYFKKVIVVKAKNYVLFDGKKIKIKGQALKGTGKEKALTDFMNDVIMLLLNGKRDHIFNLYNNVAKEINNGFHDIGDWVMKKTVTKSVLDPQRKQEQKILDAIQDIHYQEGDKVYIYAKDKDTLCLKQKYDGEYFKDAYFNKLYNTLSIFETLLDPSLFPNYKTGRNKVLL